MFSKKVHFNFARRPRGRQSFCGAGIPFRKGSCLRPSLDLAPCRLPRALQCEKCFGYHHFYCARVTTTAVLPRRPPGMTTRKYIPLSERAMRRALLADLEGGHRSTCSTCHITFAHGANVAPEAGDQAERQGPGAWVCLALHQILRGQRPLSLSLDSALGH